MRLCHCFMDLIAYTIYFKNSAVHETLSDDAVRDEITKRIEISSHLFEENGFSDEDYDLARFAVFVWIDETIMQSAWPGKVRWKKRLLQREHYKTKGGGVEFYTKLNQLEPEQNNVREVYYFCLVSGFKGMYGSSGEDIIKRDSIKSKNLKRLTGTTEGPAMSANDILFADAYATTPATDIIRPKWFSATPFAAFIIACPVVVFLFLFIIYRYILNNEMVTKLVS